MRNQLILDTGTLIAFLMPKDKAIFINQLIP